MGVGEVVVDPTKPGGDCWDDIFGACDDPPDIQVELSVGRQQGSTRLYEGYRANFREYLLRSSVESTLLSRGIAVTIWDRDAVLNDTIGECRVSVDVVRLLSGSHRVRCGAAELELIFRP